MTPPTPPPRPAGDRQLARDVAREIDRRRMRRRVTLWTGLLGLIAAALMYLRFGDGFGVGGHPGLGGGGEGSDGQRALAAPARCVIRIAASGITVEGRTMSRDEAIAACKTAPGVEVRVAGDVREGDWQALNAALQAAGIQNLVLYDPTGAERSDAVGSAAGPGGSAATGPAPAAPTPAGSARTPGEPAGSAPEAPSAPAGSAPAPPR